MKTEIENLNIPDLTVSELIDKLCVMYTNAIKKKTPFKKIFTPFLWGSPGIGKSNGVYQLAERLEKLVGKKVHIEDVRLVLFSPVDLRGVPMADEHREFTNWLKPKIFDMNDSEDYINILFLDELSSAPPKVQSAAYQICLDRKIGEHKLPDNCIVIAAGNHVADQFVSHKMQKALCNRLMHFNIKSDYAIWRKWAVENGISQKVIAFLGFDNTRLCVDPDTYDLAYCTPRSWECVSTLLNTVSDNPEEIHHLIAACVGRDAAVEFECFCEGVLKMPDINAILAGVCYDYPKSYDVLYALISALVAKMDSMGKSLSAEQFRNVCNYVSRLPKDFETLFKMDVRAVSGLRGHLNGGKNG